MWHTCDAMHTTHPIFHLYLFNTVHVLLRVAQSFVGRDVKPAWRFRSERVPVPRLLVANTFTPLQHTLGETLLGESIATFSRTLVPIRMSSVNCILPLKLGGVVLSMSGLHGLCNNY